MLEKIVVRRVKVHVTCESRKQEKDKETCNSGNEKAGAPANMGVNVDKADRAEWLACEMPEERGTVKQNIN